VRLLVVRETAARPPALEVAVAHALLERADRGEVGAVLRLYRPAPTVAFGRLDALRPGYAAAVAAARSHGFEPVLRAPGGHAVAYHDGCLGIDEVIHEADPIAGMQERFAASSELLAGALRSLGVDSRVGGVPREFCPGDFTVNARGRVKLVGTAQRVVRHGSLLAASVAVTDAAGLRAVLADVYRALELDWDPATMAAVEDEVSAGLDDVERAVLDAYADRHDLVEWTLDEQTLADARSLEGWHAPTSSSPPRRARTPRSAAGRSAAGAGPAGRSARG
jgi:octanoyl-[GcvH]:protein N-octanoyltransferase